HDRRLAEGAGYLLEALARAPVLGRRTVEVRARGGQPPRTAIVAGWQTIWRGWQRLMWMCEGANLMES
ncbi:MAG TPA: hypothetical protein VN765_10670, partial [Candidatus Acidoferrum sp.]|nr:hypothetical protein [Candidatus Acidoferrum sp.]